MCFFDQHRFVCGDWKWGGFRQHCAKEYRIGETCGMKLIHQTVVVGQKCKLCEKVDSKMRRRAAEVERVGRWQREGSKFRASIDKSMEIIKGLDGEIYELSCERNRRLQGIGTQIDGETGETSSDSGLGKEPQCRLIQKKEILLGLPITFELVGNPATVMAIPDSGAQENAISITVARALGLKLEQPDGKRFTLINGTTARWCCGVVKAWCRFGKTYDVEPEPLHCTFYVFRKLASPLLMSRGFLHDTKTLSAFRFRLVQRASSILGLPAIRALGATQERLQCSINGEYVEALPDSGSDVDVISHTYAQRRGFAIQPSDDWVMLADRTVKKAFGVCVLQLNLGLAPNRLFELSTETHRAVSEEKESDSESGHADDQLHTSASGIEVPETLYRDVIQSTFYVLMDIEIDVIVGAGSLESLEVYSRHSHFLVTRPVPNVENEEAPLNRIVLLTSLEQKLRRISRAWILRMRKGEANTQQNKPFEQTLDDADSSELARRELAKEKIARLQGHERTKAEEQELGRQTGYEKYRAIIVSASKTGGTRN